MRESTSGSSVTGRILSVQEQRFRLLGEGGQAYLFTLAASASTEPAMLRSLRDRRANVTVTYTGQPNLAGCVARNVRTRG